MPRKSPIFSSIFLSLLLLLSAAPRQWVHHCTAHSDSGQQLPHQHNDLKNHCAVCDFEFQTAASFTSVLEFLPISFYCSDLEVSAIDKPKNDVEVFQNKAPPLAISI